MNKSNEIYIAVINCYYIQSQNFFEWIAEN